MDSLYKTWIIHKLESWAETFNNNYPDHIEKVIDEENKCYDELQSLIEKISNDKCNKDDYENILFHIWQSQHLS